MLLIQRRMQKNLHPSLYVLLIDSLRINLAREAGICKEALIYAVQSAYGTDDDKGGTKE